MERIYTPLRSRIMSAAAAAEFVCPGMSVACSGFGMIGEPKLVPAAIAQKKSARDLILLTGASVGSNVDGVLTEAGLIAKRFPYQADKTLRAAANRGAVDYIDMHLSHMPAFLDRGDFPIDLAILECAAVNEQGIIPSAAVGASDCFVRNAKHLILEINAALPMELTGIHDIFYPDGNPIPITAAGQRIGTPYIPCDFDKIVAIVETDDPGTAPSFAEPDEVSQAISEHILRFLKEEISAGRQPTNLNPLQSGVGSVANAVLAGLATSGLGDLRMYAEIMQDSAYQLVREGIVTSASTTAISLSESARADFYAHIGGLRRRLVIRSQDISNHPEVIRRLNVIAMNTPIECDIYGHVNSTHIMGTSVMNGIGGSGDFTRNAGLSIFATNSRAKGGAVSSIVPMCAHVDHTEHDVQVIVTEQGLADLRWKGPRERANTIIENCAHPDYRPLLREYFQDACKLGGHMPHDLSRALSWHLRYLETGSMLG